MKHIRKTVPLTTIAVILSLLGPNGANAAPSTNQPPASAPPAAVSETVDQAREQVVTKEEVSSESVSKETDRLIVTLKNDAPKEVKEEVAQAADDKTEVLEETAVVKESVAANSATIVLETKETLTEKEQSEAIEALKSDPQVESVEPDYIVKATATDAHAVQASANFNTDRYFIGMTNSANTSISSGAGSTVAIVDTGSTSHPWLNSAYAAGGYDFISDEYYGRDGQPGRDADPTDTGTYNGGIYSNWHGTHVAGIAKSIAPDVNLLPVRVLGRAGSGYVSDFADATTYAAERADAINLSLSWYSPTCPAVMANAINYAKSKNVPVIVAAGNDGANAGSYAPANCLGAIVVGSATSWNTMAAYSNWGWPLDVVAYGGTVGSPIWSTYNTGLYGPVAPAYGTLNGTSMAAPQVTGAVARMKSVNKGMSVEEIRAALRGSAGLSISGYPVLNTARAESIARDKAPKPGFSLVPGSGIAARYYSSNGESRFGSPASNEFRLRDGGVAQNFSKNYTIYWTANLGAHPVYFSGAIGGKYRADGYENKYGYPMQEELPTGVSNGYYQRFITASGARYAIYWTEQTDAHTVYANGAIGVKFNKSGALSGWGYPVTDEYVIPGGAEQRFRDLGSGGETLVVWSEATGAASINAKGGFNGYWRSNGYTAGMGFPLHDERWESDGRVHLRFSKGAHLTWSLSEGTRRIS